MSIKVCIAGATGLVGADLARAVLAAGDLQLSGAIARGAAAQIRHPGRPGYVASAEVIFGLPDMQLSLRHDAGSGAKPYVDGTLLAIRKVATLKGLVRGLDAVLD